MNERLYLPDDADENDAANFEIAWAENEECPLCRGLSFSIGDLGGHEWYRCQDCGWEFNI